MLGARGAWELNKREGVGFAKDGNPHDLINHPPSPRLQEFLQHVS
ncbi:hypothetical protein BHT35_3092 [Serratia sp. S119]|nr:hypothetical protein BHT35_3092 [Serratia sp. S119]